MIPNVNRLLAFLAATLACAFVACWCISHNAEPMAASVLTGSVSVPFGVYITGRAYEMKQRQLDASTMAEQIDAESRAATAAKAPASAGAEKAG